MTDNPTPIDWKSRALEAEREVARCHERLEMNHAWQMGGDGGFVRVPAPEGMPDGIECRDETIKLLESSRKRLSDRLASSEATVTRMREVLEPFARYIEAGGGRPRAIICATRGPNGFAEVRYEHFLAARDCLTTRGRDAAGAPDPSST